MHRAFATFAAALLALQASWSAVALTADALGVPGAREWCPLVSNLLDLEPASQVAERADKSAQALHAHHHSPAADAPSGPPPPNHDGHHAATHECPACMSKVAVLPDASSRDWSPVRIALAHAYATREALLRQAGATGPPIGSRAPPHLSS